MWEACWGNCSAVGAKNSCPLLRCRRPKLLIWVGTASCTTPPGHDLQIDSRHRYYASLAQKVGLGVERLRPKNCPAPASDLDQRLVVRVLAELVAVGAMVQVWFSSTMSPRHRVGRRDLRDLPIAGRSLPLASCGSGGPHAILNVTMQRLDADTIEMRDADSGDFIVNFVSDTVDPAEWGYCS